ncbi:DUF1517 domain-containing protein [Pleurocapsa sp. PCC 7319]|uniref:DUF1517 domain-containing protein n=1 Tax=Pleurocapsa sp. PCC 7319 TaxID=118161 RepID=UPI00034ADDAC|nr:DUF1517 domain-containing protein [Pleurocapsa sp. PCC 7319]
MVVIAIQQINLTSATVITTNSHLTQEVITLNDQAKTTTQNTKALTYLDQVSNKFNVELAVASSENQSNLTNYHAAQVERIDEKANPNTKEVKIASLSIFLLLFISIVVFYAFFLFYKWLLGVDSHKLVRLQDSYNAEQPSAFLNPENQDVVPAKDNHQATVSKLQIAFSSQANNLQEKLAQAVLSVEIRQDQGLIELMHKTLSVLIDQEHWTHVNQTSVSLPLQDVKAEFEAIIDTEYNKSVREKINTSNSNTQVEKSSESSEDDIFKYIVVTLVICTAHKKLLHNTIHTKEQLNEELIELSQMEKDKLIKFDLVWNPGTAGNYITNNQLLREYGDLLRLF